MRSAPVRCYGSIAGVSMESLRVERTQWSQSWGDLFIRVYSLLYCRGLCLLHSSFSRSGISFHKAFHNWLLHLSLKLLSHKAEMCIATTTAFWRQTKWHDMLAKRVAHQQCSHFRKSFRVSMFLLYSGPNTQKDPSFFLLFQSASLLLNRSSLLTVTHGTIQCVWPLTSGSRTKKLLHHLCYQWSHGGTQVFLVFFAKAVVTMTRQKLVLG